MLKYGDLIKLGFERQNCNDEVFKYNYGYDWFILDKEIKRISKDVALVADWDSVTQKVTIRSIHDNGDIIAVHKTFTSIKTLTKYVNQ